MVVKVAFSDEFSERLLDNERHFNDKLAATVPQCNGRNWARFLGTFPIPKLDGFPVEVFTGPRMEHALRLLENTNLNSPRVLPRTP